jgi:hypothetical protein
MKNKLAPWGFAGLFGLVGIPLGSKQLLALLLLTPLLLLARAPGTEDFRKMTARVLRNSYILMVFLLATVFLFSGILAALPSIIQRVPLDILLLIMVYALSWAFAAGIAAFVLQALVGALLLRKKGASPEKTESAP